jgi:mannose-6-phosphate isomerase-like protein (cupin superfamily)
MSAPTVHRWNGSSYQILLSASQTGGALSVVFGELDPLVGPPPHVHVEDDETIVVLEGEVTFDIAGHRTTCGPLQAVMIPRGTPHAFRAGPKGARGLTFLTPGGFEGFFVEAAAKGFRLPTDLDQMVAAAARHGSRMVPAGGTVGAA